MMAGFRSEQVAAFVSEYPADFIGIRIVDDYRTKCIVPRSSFRLMLEAVTRLGLAA
jgi:hypothetical protein